MRLMSESQRTDFERLGLDRYATDRVHKRIVAEAKIVADEEYESDDIGDLSPGDWKSCVEIAAVHIERCNSDFKDRCENHWKIDPTGQAGSRRAKIAALKEAENGN